MTQPTARQPRLSIFLCLLATFATTAAVAAGPPVRHHVECVDGDADGFPCSNVDLLAELSPAEMGGSTGNDLWGWTDPLDGREVVLMGLDDATAFVDVTDPENPVYLGRLPTHTSSSTWRDVKVYADHALIVSEAGGHGMQVFDLTELRDVTSPPVTFAETAHYDGFGSAHNVVVNEASGYAYAVGSNTCSGGLHMVDVQDPTNPTGAGCFSADGYTHDAQCVDYAGPDPDHQGKEVCFNSNEDTLTIVDVTDKGQPVQLSRTPYAGRGYTHQGWLTEDHRHFLLDDELDELNFGHGTRTYVWDVSDLDAPAVIGSHTAAVAASDHNQYVAGGYLYQANYRAGLRILSLDDVASGELTEVAYFDVVPGSDGDGFSGAWSVYPYFASGTVAVSSIEDGLFVLRPILCTAPSAPLGLSATAAGDNAIDLAWAGSVPPGGSYNVYRSFGGCPGGSFELVASGLTAPGFTDDVSGQVEYSYTVTAVEATGFCESASSGCAAATTTGVCTAPPVFAGLGSVTNPGDPGCRLELAWSPATPNCGASVSYSVYREPDPGFEPSPANRVASGVTATGWSDDTAASGVELHYVVRATDSGSGAEDGNRVTVAGTATGPIADGSWASGAEVGEPVLSFETESGAEHIGWEASEARAWSGVRSYFSTYASNQCTAAVTPPLPLTAGESSVLSFWSLHDVEPGWDGGVVQISTDGGTSWSLLPLDQGYPGSFVASSDGCGFQEGDPAFTGTDLGWNEYTADLAPWAGQEVRIRWIFSTDGFVTEEGWYVDQITVTHTQTASACFDGLFRDGFESGDLAAWSAVVGF
jgi:choice-of-anchor B domain-containing protein